jgi:hypothetical protein
VIISSDFSVIVSGDYFETCDPAVQTHLLTTLTHLPRGSYGGNVFPDLVPKRYFSNHFAGIHCNWSSVSSFERFFSLLTCDYCVWDLIAILCLPREEFIHFPANLYLHWFQAMSTPSRILLLLFMLSVWRVYSRPCKCICIGSGYELFWGIYILSVTVRVLNITILFIIFMTSAAWEVE